MANDVATESVVGALRGGKGGRKARLAASICHGPGKFEDMKIMKARLVIALWQDMQLAHDAIGLTTENSGVEQAFFSRTN